MLGRAPASDARERDDDLALYDRIIERIARGEHYYDFIVEEQRKAEYPVRPGLAVRLPTLAYLDAWLGLPGQIAAALVADAGRAGRLVARLGEEPGGLRYARMAIALLFVGASLGLNRYFFVLHELWAGMLLALSFGLHRPGSWGWALAAAALALAIRELALPFVLLMGAWQCGGGTGGGRGVGGLALVFLALLAVHLRIVAAQTLPTDRVGQLAGAARPVGLAVECRAVEQSALSAALAGRAADRADGVRLVRLALACGHIRRVAVPRLRPGIHDRRAADNFYWGAMVAPCMFIGLAFAPMALKSLLRSALHGNRRGNHG